MTGHVKATLGPPAGESAIRLEYQPRNPGSCCARPSPAAIDIDLALSVSQPHCFGWSDNRDDVRHVTRAEASAYGKLNALEQTAFSPLLF